MLESDDIIERLSAEIASAEEARTDPREAVRSFVCDAITLRDAPALIDALPWSLESLFPDASGFGAVFGGGGTWLPGPDTERRQRRGAQRARIRRWTLRVLLDGLRPRGELDLVWRAARDVEAWLVELDDALPSIERIDAASRHPSTHVRGYAWLAWLTLHEEGGTVGRDLIALALDEPVELRGLAVSVITEIHRHAPVRPLFEGLFESSVPRHVRMGALNLLVHLPPEPLRDLAPHVAAFSRASGRPHLAWCRLDPSAWSELLVMSEEREPLVRTLAVERRYARWGRPVPTEVRTDRASTAVLALELASQWLPDDAVEALVARAHDDAYDGVFRSLGARARGAVDAIASRPLGTGRFAREHLVALLVELGGPRAVEVIEEHLRVEPELVRKVAPLGAEAVPLIRGVLARASTTMEREMALWAAASLGAPELTVDVWPHLEDEHENVVCWAIQALLASNALVEPLARSRALDAFLRFQPSEYAFGPHFYRLAESLAAVVPTWLRDALDGGDELSAVRVVRAAGFLRSWGESTVIDMQRFAHEAAPAVRAELERAKERIESPPPMFRPNAE